MCKFVCTCFVLNINIARGGVTFKLYKLFKMYCSSSQSHAPLMFNYFPEILSAFVTIKCSKHLNLRTVEASATFLYIL